MNTITLDFQFTALKKEKTHESNNIDTKNNFELFDFGLNNSYFLAVSGHYEDLSVWEATLQGSVEGNYCLISISYEEEPPFFIGINMCWLNDQIGYYSDLERIVYKTLSEWSNEYSLFTLRHLAFYEEYQYVTNRNLFIKSYFLQFLYFFVSDIQTKNSNKNVTDVKKIDLQNIRETVKKVMNDIHKSPLTVNEMAKMSKMSTTKFKNLFHELFGVSPHQYILDKKMIYAKGLLHTGMYSIRQVAYKVGYNHQSGFTRVYKQKFNHPPNITCLKNNDNDYLI